METSSTYILSRYTKSVQSLSIFQRNVYATPVTYYDLLPYAFKSFSVKRALKTGLPTALHYLTRTPLPKSKKPALFTMNILPPMATVWYHLQQKYLGDAVDTVIFDCSGTLQKKDFPNARIQKFLNWYAATKSDEFLYHIASQREIGWICDDDMFFIHEGAAQKVEEAMNNPHVASFSFRPRNWWHFEIDGNEYAPSGSYCLAIRRSVYCEQEHLSLSPRDGNTHVSHIGKPLSRYDTFDYANEQLIRKGYTCSILPEKERDVYVTGFSGMSSAVMLLWHFRKPEHMLTYLETPEKTAWKGNTLYTVLSGLLAIDEIQKMHEKITGWRYPLRSLPSSKELLRLRKDHEPLLREGHTFTRVDEVAHRLWDAL